MRRFFEVFLLCILFSAPAAAQAMRVLVLCDNLMSGYQISQESAFPAQLGRKLKSAGYTDVKILNKCENHSSADGLRQIDLLAALKPDVAVVGLAGEDAQRGIPANIISFNLGQILGKLTQAGVYTILVGVEPPADSDKNYAYQLKGTFQSLSRTYQAQLYPNALAGISGSRELTLADGYHPNGKGMDAMVENIYRMVDAGLRWKWQANQQKQQQ